MGSEMCIRDRIIIIVDEESLSSEVAISFKEFLSWLWSAISAVRGKSADAQGKQRTEKQ